MLLRNLIFIFWLKFASCGHGSAGQGGASYGNDGYWDAYGYWVEGGVQSGQGYPNTVVGTTDWNQGYTQNQNTFHHLVGHSPIQGYAPSANADGSSDWKQDGSNAYYNFDKVTQQFGNLNLHGYDPSYVYEGLGNTGEGDEDVQEEERQHMPLSIDPNEPKQYRVEIYLKRFDGGTVLLLEPWRGQKKYSTINIEKVLLTLRIADVEYNQVEDIENHIKDAELYGKVKFLERSGKLRANAHRVITTKALADRIADFYNNSGRVSNWMVHGKDYENEIFEPLFDGHIMVVLHDPGEEGRERFRIHFTMERLNLFDSVNKKNYFVIPHNGELVIMPEENIWNKGDPVRGTRWRDEKFYPQHGGMAVFTRPLTLFQILNIAYQKVIAGRTSEDQIPFKCRHFGYEFITAIAADQFKRGLLEYGNWPENIRFMDDQVSTSKRESTAFVNSFHKLAELAQFNSYNLSDYTRAIPFIPPNPVED
uniref:Uncharacterized protein n=1 Tax=Meloidogyne javanica TaxID=6303 RepID=A0A915LV99_MELJA